MSKLHTEKDSIRGGGNLTVAVAVGEFRTDTSMLVCARDVEKLRRHAQLLVVD
jgi:hypothetical protein